VLDKYDYSGYQPSTTNKVEIHQLMTLSLYGLGVTMPEIHQRLYELTISLDFLLIDGFHHLNLRNTADTACPLRRPESRIADDAAQFFFSSAIGDAGGADDVFFEHHRAYIVAAEAQSHLADF